MQYLKKKKNKQSKASFHYKNCILHGAKEKEDNHESLLSNCNRTRTHNHLVRKRTLSHLAVCDMIKIHKVSSYQFEICLSPFGMDDT